jgi:ribosomal protein L1
MRVAAKVRHSVSLPSPTAKRVRAIAKSQDTSAARVIAQLVEAALESKEREKRHFVEIGERLQNSKDRAERSRLRAELARLTFGE